MDNKAVLYIYKHDTDGTIQTDMRNKYNSI